MLNQVQIRFLEALRQAIQGESYELHVDYEKMCRQIFYIASVQKVLPMICEAAYSSASVREYPHLFFAYKKKAMEEMISQTVRTAQFLDLYRYLERRGLKPIVVKGLILQQLYPRGNLRISVDEDLLIPPGEGLLYHEAMLDYGMEQMEPEKEAAKDFEIAYTEPVSGLYVEVHQQLFPPDSEAYGYINRFFEKARSVEIEYQGQTLLTMDPTDHLFYLISHSFKHFLHSGFGIRMICDIVLFSENYADNIDWSRIRSQCREIHGERFIQAIYQIGRKYLLPDIQYSAWLKTWNIENVDEEPLLLDVLEGGVHGAADLTRLHSSNITLNAVVGQKTGKNGTVSVLNSVFLPLKSMRGRYRYLEKAPFLLPLAWTQRIIHYAGEIMEKKSKRNSVSASIKLGRQRVELLKKYGVIK